MERANHGVGNRIYRNHLLFARGIKRGLHIPAANSMQNGST